MAPPLRPRVAIGLALVALLAAGLAAAPTGLRLEYDLAKLLPDARAEDRRAAEGMRQLMRRTYLDVGPREDAHGAAAAPTTAQLGEAADRIADALIASGTVASVRTRIAADEALELVAFLGARMGVLADADTLSAIEARLRPEVVRERVHALARRLQEPEGLAMAAGEVVDPLGVSQLALAPLGMLTAGLESARLEDGRIVSAGSRHVLVVIDPGFPATDSRRTVAFLAAIEQATRALRAEPRFAALEVRHVGSHRSTYDNVRQIRRDITVASIVGIAFVFLAALAYFGRPWPAVLVLLPALFGGAFALGVVAAWTGALAALVAGFGAVLVGITDDYAVHVLTRVERAGEAPKAGGGAPLPVAEVMLGAATTGAAFLMLRLSGVPGIRDLGLFGAVGIPAAALFALYVLPVLPGAVARTRRPLVDVEGWARRFGTRRPRLGAAALVLAATPLFAIGAVRLRFDGDVTKLSSLSPESRADESAILATWGDAFRASQVVVAGESEDAVLVETERLGAELDRCRAAGGLRAHGAITALVPAAETQRARAEAWRGFWSDARLAALRAALGAAVEGTPFRADAFEPFVSAIRGRTAPIGVADLAGPLAAFQDRLIEADDGRWLAMTPVFTDAWEDLERLEARLAEALPQATLLNRELMVRGLAKRVESEMGTLALAALACVAVLVVAWHGSVLMALVLLGPLLLSCGVWTLGLLGWLEVPITLANAVFVAFLFGVAIDYGIFASASRLARFRGQGDHVAQTDAAVTFCAMTTGAAFAVLMLAGHPVLFSIGVTAVAGMASAVVVTQALVPALLRGVLVRTRTGGGPPGLANLAAALWVASALAARAIGFLVVARWLVAPGRRAAAARAHAAAMGRRLHRRAPLGRRVQLGADAAHLRAPVVIVANHGSIYDAAALLALPVPLVFVVDDRVWRAPLLGAVVRACGSILAAGRSRSEILEEARAAIAAGCSVVVFPEGARSRTGRIGRFRLGAFWLARALGVRVTPVALVGSDEVVPPGCWWIGAHDARTIVLPAIDPGAFAGRGGDRRMARAAREDIRAAGGRSRRETPTAPRWGAAIAARYRYLGWRLDARILRTLEADPLLRRAVEVCPRGDRVLVVDAGHGLLAARLALAFPERAFVVVLARGRSAGLARAALQGLDHVACVEGDLAATALPDACAAVIVDALSWCPLEAQEVILGRVASALGPAGEVLVRDGLVGGEASAKGDRPWRWLAERLGLGLAEHGPGPHRRDAADWHALLSRAGLRVTGTRTDLAPAGSLLLSAERAPKERCDGDVDRGSEGPPDRAAAAR